MLSLLKYQMDNFLQVLKKQGQNSNLSHAYLVFGHFNLEELITLLKVQRPDLFCVEEAPIKINHIRELIHWINIKPHSSPWKLAVLKRIENLTLEASNALLKVLEEPPGRSILVLQSFRKEKILPTIISRCQLIRNNDEEKENCPSIYLSPTKIAALAIKEKFDYAAQLAAEENLPQVINLWEEDFRKDLLFGKDTRSILKEIYKTRSLLSTNTSLKLLLENLLLKF